MANIPSDALVYNGHSYYIYSNVADTWEEAKAYCESLGGHLAVITSDEENTAIFEYIRSKGYSNVVFGFSDAESEGNWTWVNGESVTYTNWEKSYNEPNGGTTENYAMFKETYNDGTWNDCRFNDVINYGSDCNFICEWETEENSWKLNGTTAIYGTASNTLITVSGVKSLDGISLSGKVVTVAQASLGTNKITINDGYTLALANDVDKTSATSKAWSYSNSTATYKQTNTAYYTLAGDKKSITYNKASSKNLVTVSGVKSSSGLSVNGKVVTVAQSALSTNKVTISDGYKLALASDVATPKSTSTSWTHDGTKVTYKSAGTTAGYTITNNAITYSNAKAASALATVNGVKANVNPAVKGKVITLTKANLSSNKVTVNGTGYEFNFAKGDYKKTAITGSAKADLITSRGNNLSIAVGKGNDTVKVFGNATTITGGAGNDVISLTSAAKNNLIVYSNGDGNDIIKGLTADDTIKIAKGTAATSTSGNDVIFTVGKGKITVKDAKDKTFTYIANGVTETYSTVAPSPDDGDPYTIKGKGITLSGSYAEKSFDISEVEGGDTLVTINASLTNGLDITGNEESNYIIGSKGNDTLDGYSGNDTLTGGKGSDVFIYYEGDGNNVITDYEERDTIKILSGSVIPSTLRSDVVLKVGAGSITVKNAAKKEIGVTYIENGAEQGYLNGEKTVIKNEKETAATITANYWKSNFNFSTSTSIATLDASSAAQALTVTGNKLANSIIGSVENDYIDAGAGNDTIFSGDGNDTLYGGKGNDTLQGGDGRDIFIYDSGDGDDFIVDYKANEDTIQIKSGKLSDAYADSEGDVILKIGSGRIRIKDGKGKPITIKDSKGETTTKTYSEKSQSNVWTDDNYELSPNLSSIVQSKSVDYSFVKTSTKLSEENNLIAYTDKK